MFEHIHSEINFPPLDLENLLIEIGYTDHQLWFENWLSLGGVKLAKPFWPESTRSDWTWGLGFPFLTDIQKSLFTDDG